MAANKKNDVKVIASHHQEINGKAVKAGDEVEIAPDLAKALVRRGSAVLAKPTSKEPAKPEPKGAAK